MYLEIFHLYHHWRPYHSFRSKDQAPTRPAGAPSYINHDEDGFHTVHLDGSECHSHINDTKNSIASRTTYNQWPIDETGCVLSNKVTLQFRVSLASTLSSCRLCKHWCTIDGSGKTVTFTKYVLSWQYCYYYSGAIILLNSWTLEGTLRLFFARVSTFLNMRFLSLPLTMQRLAMRCILFFDWNNLKSKVDLSIDTSRFGAAYVSKETYLIFNNVFDNSAFILPPTGLKSFEVIHIDDRSAPTPEMAFNVNYELLSTNLIFHDQSTLQPILMSTTLKVCTISGGTQIKLYGYGLYQGVTISFGPKSAFALAVGQDSDRLFFAKAHLLVLRRLFRSVWIRQEIW